jgi:hypothetical protein
MITRQGYEAYKAGFKPDNWTVDYAFRNVSIGDAQGCRCDLSARCGDDRLHPKTPQGLALGDCDVP